jgi:hypothetical protein
MVRMDSLLYSLKTRRGFLKTLRSLLLSGSTPWPVRRVMGAGPAPHTASAPPAIGSLLQRVLPGHAGQFQLSLASTAPTEPEKFQITGSPGRIHIAGSSQSSLLMGVHWYLKYVAGVSISWNGDCLERLPATLPAPSAPITRAAQVRHRFALNDTNDGYTGPSWTWHQWEKMIDVLALHGINEVLVYMGAEAVYQQTFEKFGYSPEELRAWFPTPAHQPWWLLDNLSGWVGPSVAQHLIEDRMRLAAKITARLRELGITPVLPGYYGIVPDAFPEKNPTAHIIPQGEWLGMKRPDWLDPTCDLFPRVASEYYRTQQRMLGTAAMFKMDPLHEGGRAGTVNITEAARCIDRALQQAQPGAVWAILGWQDNPRRELLAGIEDKQHCLILDGLSDRYPEGHLTRQWDETPYAFGSIWNFGGHTTMGANISVWNDRYFNQLNQTHRTLHGIAVMPEASCNNPAAFAFLTEMAWHAQRPDLVTWFQQWSQYRYGATDASATQAWDILRRTAYSMQADGWSEAHDNLFSAQPSLTAKSACSWSPQAPRYDLDVFAAAVHSLLAVAPSVRNSTAYRYDLVDVARQTLANRSRLLLPSIHGAYAARDRNAFHTLTTQWLEQIDTLDAVTATEPSLLLGSWLRAAEVAAQSAPEASQLEFDACCLLLEWGPASSRGSGVHDYANREWNGLLGFYRERWAAYFSALEASLESDQPPKEIDWFAVDQAWSRKEKRFATKPRPDAYAVVGHAMARLH